jgi:hypothetical protein
MTASTRRLTARRLPTLAAIGLVTVTVTGCGGGTLDATRIEKAIEVSTALQRHVLSIAVCPTGIARQAGKQFTCTVTVANGSQFRFLVTEKDGNGNVHYQEVGTR